MPHYSMYMMAVYTTLLDWRGNQPHEKMCCLSYTTVNAAFCYYDAATTTTPLLLRRCYYDAATTTTPLLQRRYYYDAATTTTPLLLRCCYYDAATTMLLLRCCYYDAATMALVLCLVCLSSPGIRASSTLDYLLQTVIATIAVYAITKSAIAVDIEENIYTKEKEH